VEIHVAVTPDDAFEPDETVTLTLTGTSGDGFVNPAASSATGTIINDDLPRLVGTPGDDIFAALPGGLIIEAGGGNDTVTFGCRLVDASVTYQGNQIIIDAAINGVASHTVLTGVERFVFSDGTVENNDGNRLVDDLFYYSRYHDVWTAHADADSHYNTFGWHENRDPSAFFSTSIYLSANPDVKVAHVDPLLHYLTFGYEEGRQPFAPTELIAANGFDFVFYLSHNPDVAAAGVDPFQHFQTVGWQEGRNPNALFDTNGYLAAYTDVAAAHINPLTHYNQFGWLEGRDPSVNFDTSSYLAAYADVAAASVDPLVHFLAFGQHEGRSPFADGVWG
jgi:hypothetical protein